MKNFMIRIFVLILVFTGVGAGVYYKQNFTGEVEDHLKRERMLPIIYMSYEGKQINGLYGYVQEMKASYMRDSLTPLADDRVLTIQIDSGENKILALSYEVRTLDQSRLLEKTEVEEWYERDGYVQADLKIENLIERNTEYLLTIVLTTEEGGQASYYTRIVQGAEDISDKLEYVLDFSRKTFHKEEAEELIPYLESSSSGDNTNFGYVNIHSSFAQITWGELEPERLTEPVPVLYELQDDTSSISLTYFVKADNMYGTEEFYKVTEVFRTRYTPARTYLLDYERTMQQFFREVSDNINNNRINLGIQPNNEAEMQASPSGNVTAFSSNGEVWTYRAKTNEIINLYGRHSLYNLETWSQHEAKIIRVDDIGDVYFMIYGYLDGGPREGENGLSFQHYHAESGETEEVLYIPYEKSYGCLKESLGNLFTLTEDNSLYFLLEGNVYTVDLASTEYMLTIKDLTTDRYVINPSGNVLAWQEEQDTYQAQTIRVLFLDENREFTIHAESGSYLRVLGFIGDDLAYGSADESDIFRNRSGSIECYMSKLIIIDRNQQQAGSYEKAGYYFTNAEFSENMITLQQYEKTENGTYEPVKEEHIVSNTAEEEKKLTATVIATERKKKELGINLIEPMGNTALISAEAVEKERQMDKTLILGELPEAYFSYYIYAKGRLLEATNFISDAIQTADQNAGVVLAYTGNYVWTRYNKNETKTLSGIVASEETADSFLACVDILLKYAGAANNAMEWSAQGRSADEILNAALTDRILDLSGCTLKEVLYFVDSDRPVIGKLEGRYVLVIGFDNYNAILFDPNSNSSYKIGLEDGTAAFAKEGNEFISYRQPDPLR